MILIIYTSKCVGWKAERMFGITACDLTKKTKCLLMSIEAWFLFLKMQQHVFRKFF